MSGRPIGRSQTRFLDSYGMIDSSGVANVSRIECSVRLKQEEMNLIVRNRLVLDAVGYDDTLALLK